MRGAADDVTIELEGDLDFTTADEVCQRLWELPYEIAALDVSQLEFIDARGVSTLRELAHAFGSRQGSASPLPIRGGNRHILRTFEVVDRGLEIPVA